MNRATGIAGLAIVLAFAAFLRLYRLSVVPPGFLPDEAVDANNAVEAWRTRAFRIFYPENYGREGLMINLQAVSLGLLGSTEIWAARLPSALFGVLTVLGVYLLATKFVRTEVALLAALLLATSSWHITVSRLGTRSAAAPCCLVFGLYLLALGCERSANRGRLDWPMAILAGVVFGLGFYTYTAYRVTPLIVLAALGLLAARCGKKTVARVVAVAGAVAIVMVLPLGVYAATQPEIFFQRLRGSPALSSATPLRDAVRNAGKTVAMFNFHGDENPRHNIPGRPMLFWPVGMLFLAGVVWTACKQRLWLWWIAFGALPAVLAGEGVPHGFRSVMALPAVFVVAAIGGGWLFERLGRFLSPRLLQSLCVVSCIALASEAYHFEFRRWANDPRVTASYEQPLLAVARTLDSLPPELPKYVIIEPDGTDIRGLPLGAQNIMFLTDTFSPERQREKNLRYLLPDQTNQMAQGYIYVHRIGVLHE